MAKEPKYLKVLLHLYNEKQKGNGSIHYYQLRNVIYDYETIAKYSHARRNKVVIDYMVCVYMGKLCRKDFCGAEYKTNKNQKSSGYSYFVGYYIRPDGVKVLKQKGLI
jgi:hypothetical protein